MKKLASLFVFLFIGFVYAQDPLPPEEEKPPTDLTPKERIIKDIFEEEDECE